MKGVVLAGGLGSRLKPLTKITNKHLLPVFRKPMVFYPIEMLVQAGITEIAIVTGGERAGDLLRLIGSGKQLGASLIDYVYQEGETGIAAALALVEEFAEGRSIVTVLGDNFLEKGIGACVEAFRAQKDGARLLFKEMDDPSAYGVPEFEGEKLVRLLEKPENPPTSYANVGVFMYPPDVFEVIGSLKPRDSGELEITDVNNVYISQNRMEYDFVEGWWIDAGDSPDALLRAGFSVAKAEGAL
jgi:glucose-1-phosphate thymidylyltransferase